MCAQFPDFDKWFEEVEAIARENGNVAAYPFAWRPLFDKGLSPRQAYKTEF